MRRVESCGLNIVREFYGRTGLNLRTTLSDTLAYVPSEIADGRHQWHVRTVFWERRHR